MFSVGEIINVNVMHVLRVTRVVKSPENLKSDYGKNILGVSKRRKVKKNLEGARSR